MSYRNSGVDIDAGDRLGERIRPLAEKTWRPGCLGAIGGFGGLFELPFDRYRHPVLVSGTDGVGTKLKLAFELDRHDTIGIDLVAMCANDVLTCGAEPLFFLDYFSTGALDPVRAESVIAGISRGCQQAGAALVGGETAEMPGFYVPGEYDLAGFCVGVVEKERIIDGHAIRSGNQVLGLTSSGPHANGYSLIRAVLEQSHASLATPLGNGTLGEALLSPTRIYVPTILALQEKIEVSAIAHITGGGLPGNIGRIIPPNLEARIDRCSWEQPLIFQWLENNGNISSDEMLRTFNCGVGLILVVEKDDARLACDTLEDLGEQVFVLGEIVQGHRGVV
ncbi:MAG: phosphoribosylformylglycinamidine cyclo-ligase, partial [Alphaproteobacteria bacterium]|nr:phosphoribosylformylglycinamidine cyclo-ligase [Alphaproteobacteria bacterium]